MFKKVIGASLLAASSFAIAADQAPADPVVFEKASSDKTIVGVSLDLSILLGLGISVSTPLPYGLTVRGMYHGYTHEDEFEDDGGNYDGEFKLSSFGAMLDYFPFGGAFRLTAGLMSNGNKISLNGVANDSNEFEIGDCSYVSNPADPLRVNGTVDFKSTAPYLGLGFGGNSNSAPGFFGTFDIGVMFSGAPTAALSAGGSATVSNNPDNAANGCGAAGTPVNAASDPTVQQELRDAEREANEEAKDFKLWPNISFGLGWRF